MDTRALSQSSVRTGSTWRGFASLMLVVLLGAAGCDKDREIGEQDVAAEGASAASAVPNAATGGAVASDVPPAVESLGHFAEGVYDHAKLSDWALASAAVDSLRASADRLTPSPGPSAPSLAAVRTSVDALARSVAAHDRSSALRDANHLTAVGARLSEEYHPQIPVEVTMLDYYGRELEIWSASNDLPKLHESSAAIRRRWDAVRPAVLARGGAAESVQFEALVKRVEAARTTSAFGATATPVLNAVDVLEAVFRR